MKSINSIGIVAAAVAVGLLSAPLHAADSATVSLQPASGSSVTGRVTFTQEGSRVRIEGDVRGLRPGAHGFHLHEKGDCSSQDAESAGGHFNPGGKPHGGPHGNERHAGDFGNITADAAGNARISTTVTGISVARDRPDGIVGRGLIVHADPDDQKTDPSGKSGARLACGVIK